MAVIQREDDVLRLLPMSTAIEALEVAFHALAVDVFTTNLPRRRAVVQDGALAMMAAAWREVGSMGAKIYSAFSTAGGRDLLALYPADDGVLAALIEADWRGRIRTGAASGTRYRTLEPGVRVNAVGSNWPERRELDDANWSTVHELADLVAGHVSPRRPEDISLFTPVSLAIEDVAVAGHVYRVALERGLGEHIACSGPWEDCQCSTC
jgi:ornithine cyclodeaminase/alanine dehydrogenase-like protein (mu-crystallin family)